jgi:SNF2 family DNA or RNA helicase
MKVWSVSNTFYCDAPETSIAMKEHGWRWLTGKRCWMTSVPRNVAPFIDHCDAPTRAKVDRFFTEREEAIAASKAASVEIAVPAPPELAYRPYQLAGIDFMAKRHTVLNADVPRLGKSIMTLGVVNLRPECRRLVVLCPAMAKINWRREILKWSVKPVRTAVLEGNASAEDVDRLVAALRLGDQVRTQPRQKGQHVDGVAGGPDEHVFPGSVDAAPSALSTVASNEGEHLDGAPVGALDGDLDVTPLADVDVPLAVDDPSHVPDSGAVALFEGLKSLKKIDIRGDERGCHLHVLIVNYDILASWLPVLQAFRADIVTADEAHYLKNAKTGRTQAFFQLPKPALHKLYLTGSPIFTRPVDLWNLVEDCDPQGLGKNWFGFVKRYCNARKIGGRWDMDGSSNEEELQFKMRSRFMIRREKSDVLTELPTSRIPIWMPKKGLEKLVKAERNYIQKNLSHLWEALQEEDAPQDVLDQFAEHDGRHEGSPNSSTRRDLGLAKLPMVLDFVNEIRETERKLVVFAHHRDVVETLHRALPKSAMIIGGMGNKPRQDVIDRFREDPELEVVVASISAVREAISLAAADTAIYAELSWIPAEMDQSEERIWDVTKTVPCTIYHCLVEDSGDALMHQVLERRQANIARMTHARFLNLRSSHSCTTM